MSVSVVTVFLECVKRWICTAYRTAPSVDLDIVDRYSYAIGKALLGQFDMTVEAKSKAELVKAANLSLNGLEEVFTPPRLSKPEMHLLLKPFFVLDRQGERFKPIEYVYSVMQNGKAITRRWWVEPHSLYGLPGPFDRDVTIVLYEIVNEDYLAKGLPVPEIMPIGSLRDFAARMGIKPNSGKNIAAIKESLKRLKNTLVDAEETFFNNKKRRYVSVRLTLLRGLIFTGDEDDNGGSYEQNFVTFDETILSNLNSGYVMVVDVDCLRTLKTNIAKQLYTHLAYRFFVETQDGDDCWVADYDWLTVHLGIKLQKELWRAKQQLESAHEELKELGYISDYRWDGWRVLYSPGPVWKGEQLRRGRGNVYRQLSMPLESLKHNNLIAQTSEPHDPLIPALVAFASGLSVGEERIKVLGLTTEQAQALCAEKSIPLRNQK
jgi:hypothetical protein